MSFKLKSGNVTPFKMMGSSSPLKDDATTGEAPHPEHHKESKKKSDEAFIAAAKRQRKEQIANIAKEHNTSIKEATQIYLKKVGTEDALTEAANRADN